MGIVFCDSFDHLSTTELLLNLKWTAHGGAPVITSGAGRRGTQALVAPNASSSAASVSKTLAADPSWGVSVAFKPSRLPDAANIRRLISLLAGGSVQVELAWNDVGQLVLRDGAGTVLATGTGGPTTGVFRSLELQAVIGLHYTADLVAATVEGVSTYTRASGDFTSEGFQVGQVLYVTGFTLPANNGAQLITAVSALVLTVTTGLVAEIGEAIGYSVGMARGRLDGVVLVEVLGVETGDAPPDTVRLGPTDSETTTTYTWDDLVVQQGNGLTLLGDVEIDATWPSADGELAEWTGSYGLIDDLLPDHDGTVLTGQTVGQQSTFAFPPLDLASDVGIHALALNIMARIDVDAPAHVAGVIQSEATVETLLPALAVGTTYQVRQAISDTDPATALPWTLEALDAAERGVEVVA
jgi:hypothetical protein